MSDKDLADTPPVARYTSQVGGLTRGPRSRGQTGSIMVVSMLVLLALLSIAGLSAVQVKGNVKASGNERFKMISLMAAESGLEASYNLLRVHYHVQDHWKSLVSPNNQDIYVPTASQVPGNGVKHGQSGNPFDPKLKAWFEVKMYNNIRDPGFATGEDIDSVLIVESTGYGPNNTVTKLVVELQSPTANASGRPCPTYGQRGMHADNAGYNACLGLIDLEKACSVDPRSGQGIDPNYDQKVAEWDAAGTPATDRYDRVYSPSGNAATSHPCHIN